MTHLRIPILNVLQLPSENRDTTPRLAVARRLQRRTIGVPPEPPSLLCTYFKFGFFNLSRRLPNPFLSANGHHASSPLPATSTRLPHPALYLDLWNRRALAMESRRQRPGTGCVTLERQQWQEASDQSSPPISHPLPLHARPIRVSASFLDHRLSVSPLHIAVSTYKLTNAHTHSATLLLRSSYLAWSMAQALHRGQHVRVARERPAPVPVRAATLLWSAPGVNRPHLLLVLFPPFLPTPISPAAR